MHNTQVGSIPQSLRIITIEKRQYGIYIDSEINAALKKYIVETELKDILQTTGLTYLILLWLHLPNVISTH